MSRGSSKCTKCTELEIESCGLEVLNSGLKLACTMMTLLGDLYDIVLLYVKPVEAVVL